MQNTVLKNLLRIACISLFPFTSLHAQLLNYHLGKADSLFQQKRYTQSLEFYESIFDKGQYTPAMLLKMAYIEEGLGNVSNTLYYLSVYHERTQDDRVLVKINELAGKHRLSGYEPTDLERFLSFYQQYRYYVTGVLLTSLLFMLALLAYNRRKDKQITSAFISLVLISVLLAVQINFEPEYRTAVVTNPVTYAMTGPSAGASVVKILDDGHRLHVRGKKDVWYRIDLNGQHAYVRRDNLRIVNP